ncbi:hypothetical protein [Mesorhizobium sp.]|uniref:hypothetical protein n=1 Tax=Mesorhizobium sp. TaxID=1871066 RepID=UPI0025CE7CD9|nr:hypothetical protein [Mesorhizobium sp.]
MYVNPSIRKTTSTVFSGPKCKVAIPVNNVLQRDALLQASLDPSVCAIHYRTTPNLYGSPPTVRGVVLQRMDGDFLLVACESRPRRTEEEHIRLADVLISNGLRLLERDADDIHREPLFSNARAVWDNQRFVVSVHNRLKIAAALAEDGPQSILELEERVRPTCDLIGAVSALACEMLVELDLREMPLGPRTVVRAS